MSDVQHLGAVAVSGELMRDLFFAPSGVGRWYRIESGIPADAEFVRCYEDQAHNRFVFVYRHPTFPKCYPGERVTFLDPPTCSALHLTAPLDAAQVECVEACIAEQKDRAARAEAARRHPSEVYAALMRPPLAFSKEQIDGLTMEQARVLMAVAEPTALTSPEMSPEAATRLCAELERPRNARRMVVLPDGADVRRSVSPVTAPDWSTTAPADVLAAIDVSRKAAMDRGVSLGPDGLTSELRADCVVSADVIAKQVATEIDLRGSDAPVVLTPEQGKAFRALLDPEPPATCATCNGARFVARAVPGRLFAQSLPCPACGPML